VGKSEYVLCTVRWDSITGVLMVTPDFTSLASSAEHISRLDPYRIEVDGDARNTYHYWIEHASNDMSQEEKDKEFAVINKVSVIVCTVRPLSIVPTCIFFTQVFAHFLWSLYITHTNFPATIIFLYPSFIFHCSFRNDG
jgi:hypothetical protein